MPQTRLFRTAPRIEAERLFETIESALEDEGVPAAIAETFDDSGIFEVSLYAEAEDVPGLRAKIAGALGVAKDALDFAEEPVPDIDWVTKSLEGLGAVRAGRFIVHEELRRPG